MKTLRFAAPGWVSLFVLVGMAGVSGCSADAPRNEAGQVTASAAADVVSLKVGDCTGKLTEGVVESTDLVPCKDKHYFEAYAATRMTGDTPPDDDAPLQQAEEFCQTEFATFVGTAAEESDYVMTYLVPTEQSWLTMGDRAITCLVGSDEGTITGSLKGAKK